MPLGGGIGDRCRVGFVPWPPRLAIPGDPPIEGLLIPTEGLFKIGRRFTAPEIDLSLRVATSQQAKQWQACDEISQLAAP